MSRYANKDDYDKCEHLHGQGGNVSVYDYANLNDLHWGYWCDQCEAEVPPVLDTYNNQKIYYCLCCGGDLEKISQTKGSTCEKIT